ncbi:MAG: nitrous oxide reductase family maturation protein NosD, partial [Promethearchaeota archaeon]
MRAQKTGILITLFFLACSLVLVVPISAKKPLIQYRGLNYNLSCPTDKQELRDSIPSKEDRKKFSANNSIYVTKSYPLSSYKGYLHTSSFVERWQIQDSGISMNPLQSLFSPRYTPHANISVNSDAELATVAVSGLGTEIDPYVLEGWNITTSGVPAISIKDTTKYFLIRNCWVNTGAAFNAHGIFIHNVTRRTATILNNICGNSRNGIYIKKSGNSTVVNNLCSYNTQYGIYLDQSGNSTIANNTCYRNNDSAIFIRQSGYSTIVNNTCRESSYGIWIWNSKNSTVGNNICFQNTDCGILIQSPSMVVVKNICRENDEGIHYEGSTYSIVANNTCQEN